MGGVERGAGGDDDDEGLLRPAAAGSQLGQRSGRRRIRAIDPPRSLRRGEQRSRADDDGVRAGAHEGEDEAVGLAFVSDHRVRARQPRDGDDAVERLDEVRDDARLVEADRAAVELGELVGHVPPRQVLVLGEDAERLDHRVSVRNSERSDSSSSYRPRQTVVTVTEPSSSTPRIAVHRCAASSLTATPRAPASCRSPSAISSASRSCTVKRRA